MSNTKHSLHLGLPNGIRNEVIAGLSEFCGTFMFLFMAFAGTTDAQKALQAYNPETSGTLGPDVVTLLYISSCFGMSLAVNVWVFYRISGGMLNPVVALALALVGAISPVRAVVNSFAEIIAGIAAAYMADALIPGDLTVANTLGARTSIGRGFVLEIFMTAQLVIVVLFLAVEKHKATYLAPICIGMSVFMAHMVGVYLTGCSINPARAFGPAIIQGFPGYHWIYWIGPVFGALLATGVYKLFLALDYTSTNRGQDWNDIEKRDSTLYSEGTDPSYGKRMSDRPQTANTIV